jgi:hypothetical protein
MHNQGIGKFFRPINDAEEWRLLLAQPGKHWRTCYSAKTLAYCWQEAGDFPPEVTRVFRESGIPVFKDVKMLIAFPEYQVSLSGGKRASQSDIFILAKGDDQLISIAVEGKVDETFGEVVYRWRLKDKGGKEDRLKFLCDQLMLSTDLVGGIHYQLLHRAASAVIEAKKFSAPIALMLVHAFEKTKDRYDESFQAYCGFLNLFGKQGKENTVISLKILGIVNLYTGWVKGNPEYLKDRFETKDNIGKIRQ